MLARTDRSALERPTQARLHCSMSRSRWTSVLSPEGSSALESAHAFWQLGGSFVGAVGVTSGVVAVVAPWA